VRTDLKKLSTETAVKAFQKDQNLIADGQVGSLTVETLYKDYA
jgi:peptidoglycan hydrolase-like protein with peptidoglycan-binding domain